MQMFIFDYIFAAWSEKSRLAKDVSEMHRDIKALKDTIIRNEATIANLYADHLRLLAENRCLRNETKFVENLD